MSNSEVAILLWIAFIVGASSFYCWARFIKDLRVDRNKTEAKAKCIWCYHSTGSLHETEVNCFCTDLFAEISELANYPVYVVMREECPDYFHYCKHYKEDPAKRKKGRA